MRGSINICRFQCDDREYYNTVFFVKFILGRTPGICHHHTILLTIDISRHIFVIFCVSSHLFVKDWLLN